MVLIEAARSGDPAEMPIAIFGLIAIGEKLKQYELPTRSRLCRGDPRCGRRHVAPFRPNDLCFWGSRARSPISTWPPRRTSGRGVVCDVDVAVLIPPPTTHSVKNDAFFNWTGKKS